MTKLPTVTGRECINAFLRAGFVVDRQKGSHATLFREEPFGRATIPNSRKALKKGTLRRILRDAEMSIDEFIALL